MCSFVLRLIRLISTCGCVTVCCAFGAAAPAAEPLPVDSEVAALKEQVAELRRQTEESHMLLLDMKKQIDMLKSQLAAVAPPPPTGIVAALYAPRGDTPEAKPGSSVVTPLPQNAQPAAQASETGGQSFPLQMRLGSSTVTPLGFMDLTNTFRSTNAGTSLQTNFGSIPYNNVAAGRLTEDKFSAANSRIGFRVDGTYRGLHLLGYYEGDFVGGVTGNNTQVSSNSLVYRLRLYWIDVRKGKFEMLAGQSWSMMTPNRQQISALPPDLFYGQVVDVNYINGLVWGRIPGIRFLYHPSNKVTLGVSLENSAQYFGGSGGGGSPTLPAALPGLSSQVDGGAVNGVAVPNVDPDIIGKVALDPSSRVHVDLAGVLRSVRLFNSNTQQYFAKTGGGGSLNAGLEFVKGLRLVTNNYWSDGGGRYLFGVAPDFIVQANGNPSFVHSASTVSGLEFQRNSIQLYAYYGGIYIGRNTALDLNGPTRIGYGFSGSTNAQNRTTQEVTGGLTRTLFKDPKYGSVQMMLEYAYFLRNPWYAAPGAPKNAHESAVWFNLRYVLPGQPPAIKY